MAGSIESKAVDGLTSKHIEAGLARTESPLIRFDDVSLTFEAKKLRAPLAVLADVSLDVREGEFVCIIGPSGCGKSTLLSLLAGFFRPTEGRVVVRGTSVREPGSDRAMVFQSSALFPWLTVSNNVSYGLKLKANRAQLGPADKVPELLKLVGLEGFGDHYPFELSGGMRQRVEIARALAVNPDILLMDEPLGALDALTRLTMQAELARIWQETRKTILFVTHDIEEAVILADRVVVMSSRPAHVSEDIAVPLPRPRHRGDPQVTELAHYIAELLHVSF